MTDEYSVSVSQRNLLKRLESGLPVVINKKTADDMRWLLENGYIERLPSPISGIEFLSATDKGRLALEKEDNAGGK